MYETTTTTTRLAELMANLSPSQVINQSTFTFVCDTHLFENPIKSAGLRCSAPGLMLMLSLARAHDPQKNSHHQKYRHFNPRLLIFLSRSPKAIGGTAFWEKGLLTKVFGDMSTLRPVRSQPGPSDLLEGPGSMSTEVSSVSKPVIHIRCYAWKSSIDLP